MALAIEKEANICQRVVREEHIGTGNCRNARKELFRSVQDSLHEYEVGNTNETIGMEQVKKNLAFGGVTFKVTAEHCSGNIQKQLKWSRTE